VALAEYVGNTEHTANQNKGGGKINDQGPEEYCLCRGCWHFNISQSTLLSAAMLLRAAALRCKRKSGSPPLGRGDERSAWRG
jgi:hypothetical protein